MNIYFSPLALLTLAACATTGTTPGASNAQNTLAQVQAAAVQACRFEPDLNTVASIVATFGGPGAVAAQGLAAAIGDAICHAVTKPTAELTTPHLMLVVDKAVPPAVVPTPKPRPVPPVAKRPPPVVNGVVIHGRFLK